MSEYEAWNIRYVLEGTLWASVRRTVGKWNVAGLYGPFLPHEESCEEWPLTPPSERPSMRYDYRQLFGFDPDASGSCSNPDVQDCLL